MKLGIRTSPGGCSAPRKSISSLNSARLISPHFVIVLSYELKNGDRFSIGIMMALICCSRLAALGAASGNICRKA